MTQVFATRELDMSDNDLNFMTPFLARSGLMATTHSTLSSQRGAAETIQKRCDRSCVPRNDKALNNQGFVVHKMAEAMGFELMDLLQSTVFKTAI